MDALAHGECIEQGLGRVLVGAVAGVYDVGVNMAAQEMRCAGAGVAHHDHVHFHGQYIVYCIEQGFAFFNGAAAAAKVDYIGRESFFGQFKREPGTGRVFEKYIGNRDITQGRNLFNRSVENFFEFFSRFND